MKVLSQSGSLGCREEGLHVEPLLVELEGEDLCRIVAPVVHLDDVDRRQTVAPGLLEPGARGFRLRCRGLEGGIVIQRDTHRFRGGQRFCAGSGRNGQRHRQQSRDCQ
jgi:hypothetical protein